MAHVTLPEIEQWLGSKLDLAALPTDLEATASVTVLSRLSAVYDVSTWTTDATTPALVRKVISLFVAGWEYDRHFAEDAISNVSYGTKLEMRAEELLALIISGAMAIDDIVVVAASQDRPGFWPTTDATDLWKADPTDPEGAARYFEIGVTW